MSNLLDKDIPPQGGMQKDISSKKPFPLGKERFVIGFQVVIVLVVAFFLVKDKLILPLAIPWSELTNKSTNTGQYTIYRQKDGTVMVLVPEGEFIMGSITGRDNTRPLHRVYLDGFWIDQTEVTIGMYRRFVTATGYKTDAEVEGTPQAQDTGENWKMVEGVTWQFPRGPEKSAEESDQFPVTQVSWNDAMAYCKWTGKRLPTEAEWEKAARGTNGRNYPWGNGQLSGNLLNIAQMNDGFDHTAPVGSYPMGISPYGALDMAGNVDEWVYDWYDKAYYATSPSRDPQGASTGDWRVLRGGSWTTDPLDAFVYSRGTQPPSFWGEDIGFRCAVSQAEFEQLNSISSRTPIPSQTLTPSQTVTLTASPTITSTITTTITPSITITSSITSTETPEPIITPDPLFDVNKVEYQPGAVWMECSKSDGLPQDWKMIEKCFGNFFNHFGEDEDKARFGERFQRIPGHRDDFRITINGDVYETKSYITNQQSDLYTLYKNGKLFTLYISGFSAYDPNQSLQNVGGKAVWEMADPEHATVIYDGHDLRQEYNLDAAYRPYGINDKLIFVAIKDSKYFVFYNGEQMGPAFDRIHIGYCCDAAAYDIGRGHKQYWFWGTRENRLYLVVFYGNP